jgi:hypothetical protein
MNKFNNKNLKKRNENKTLKEGTHLKFQRVLFFVLCIGNEIYEQNKNERKKSTI